MQKKYLERLTRLYEQKVISDDHLRVFVHMTKEERDALLRKKAVVSTSEDFTEFGGSVNVGTVIIPKNVVVKDFLKSFFKDTVVDSSNLMDSKDLNQLCNPGIFKSGQRFKVRLHQILQATTTEHCVRFLQNENARPLGAFGLALIHPLELPKDVRLLSLHSYEIGDRLSGLVKNDVKGMDVVVRPYYHGVRTKGEQLVAFIPS